MKHRFLTLIGVGLGLVAVALATPVRASFVDINFSTTGVSQFQLSPSVDQLRIDAQASTPLHLDAGVPTLATINNLYFQVGDSGYLVGNFGFSLDRTMTISADTQVLSQSGTLSVTLAADQFLVLNGSPSMVFHLVQGDVTVTPLGLTTDAFGVGGSGNYAMQADFLFTPVPEPTTVIAGVLLLLPFGASTVRILRRNRLA